MLLEEDLKKYPGALNLKFKWQCRRTQACIGRRLSSILVLQNKSDP